MRIESTAYSDIRPGKAPINWLRELKGERGTCLVVANDLLAKDLTDYLASGEATRTVKQLIRKPAIISAVDPKRVSIGAVQIAMPQVVHAIVDVDGSTTLGSTINSISYS